MGKIKFDKKLKIWCVRIILTLLCILMIAWIFSNSLKDSTQSGQQSSQVTEGVQDVLETFKPDLSLGGATEQEDFYLLHSLVRSFAHFAEFALLCALVTWCVLSYTKIKYFFAIPLPFCFGVAVLDEYLQTFAEGRTQELADVLMDCLGACAGFAFALASIWLVGLLLRYIKNKKSLSDGGRD